MRVLLVGYTVNTSCMYACMHALVRATKVSWRNPQALGAGGEVRVREMPHSPDARRLHRVRQEVASDPGRGYHHRRLLCHGQRRCEGRRRPRRVDAFATKGTTGRHRASGPHTTSQTTIGAHQQTGQWQDSQRVFGEVEKNQAGNITKEENGVNTGTPNVEFKIHYYIYIAPYYYNQLHMRKKFALRCVFDMYSCTDCSLFAVQNGCVFTDKFD